MLVLHEGSCLYVPRGNDKLVIADDVTLTEACELRLQEAKYDAEIRSEPKPFVSPVVRKVLKPLRRSHTQVGTGWPKS